MQFIYQPYVFFLFSILIYVWNFFPIDLDLDALSMYRDAQQLRFVDYWPPLTLVVWHGLDKVIPGGDLMLFFNLLFFWGACYIGFTLFRNQKISYFYLFIPFIPSIFLDAGHILKDTLLSFGYMFLSMILAHYTLREKNLSIPQSTVILGGLFYFSMVKVQAQFFFPLMIFWILWLLPSFSPSPLISRVLKGITIGGLSIAFLAGFKLCNEVLIKENNNAHFWQYVKIYDLAGMSVMGKKMYVPQFLWKKPQVTLEDVERHYDYLWEPLIRHEDSPLVQTKNEMEREELMKTWRNALWEDPLSYLKHRARLWIQILGGSALKGEYVKWAKDSEMLLKFAWVFSIFSFLPLLPFSVYFTWVGLRHIKTRKEALPLFVLSGMGNILLLVLFVFSLAAAGRYIYFSWCCFMFAVPFYWRIRSQTSGLVATGS